MMIDQFVYDFLNEYITYQDCYDDMIDLLDATIDNLVSLNSVEENKKIIEIYCGDVYDAMMLHKEHFPDENITGTKELYYERLAFVSMFVKIYPVVNSHINRYDWDEKLFIKEFSMMCNDEDDEEKITDMLDTTICEYVSSNSYILNKEIVLRYCGNISNAINKYIEVIGNIHYTNIENMYSQLASVVIFLTIYPKISIV